MRWRRASFGLAFLAVAAVAVAVAVRADGPAQPLAAPTATAPPEAVPTAKPTAAPTLTPETAPAPTPPPIPQVELGDFLEGGGTYALPGGAWIFDVPEGMRLWHNGDEPGRNPGDPPNGFGFMDRVTGSLITIYLRPDGSLDFYGFNYGSTPAARELADAWLPAIEASVRRPPGFVEPAASGEAVAGPGANPAGVPYLRDYEFHEEVFAGGRTYATPDDKWLVDVPAGLSVMFLENTQSRPFGGEAVDTYGFDAVGTWSSIYINKTTGKFAGRIGTVNSQMDALAASFRKP